MRERENALAAERAFWTALAEAQAEITPVLADSANPQTRSKYASMAAIDRAIRPIVARCGLALSFSTEDAPTPEMVRVVCDVAHSAGHSRHYTIDMPVDTRGPKGGELMTRTHAVGSGVTYGRRYLISMIFNLAIDRDDDGNAAGYRTRGYDATNQRKEVMPIGCRREDTAERQHTDTRPVSATPAAPTDADADITARRASVQLQRSFEKPAYVIEPPRRKLDRALDTQRHTGSAYEAQIRSEHRRDGRFRQPLQQHVPAEPAGQYNEREPPSHIHDDADIPGFLDRRGGRR